jgi:hypothetical protein
MLSPGRITSTPTTISTGENAMDPRSQRHEHTPEEERRNREASLDHTIADSFPASDPPSSDPNPDDDSVLEPEPPDDIQGKAGV